MHSLCKPGDIKASNLSNLISQNNYLKESNIQLNILCLSHLCKFALSFIDYVTFTFMITIFGDELESRDLWRQHGIPGL